MKRLLAFMMLVCACTLTFSQATDLVVDNQTPGWLSSKINYGDQVTVRNLKVTGYINATDLNFIGLLIQSHKLNGKLDLYDVSIVANSVYAKDNFLGHENGDVKTFGLTKNSSLDTLLLPHTLVGLNNFLSYDSGKLFVNTLFFNCDSITFAKKEFFGGNYVKEYILGENIDSIPANAFSNCNMLHSVTIKGNLKYIGNKAFYKDTLSNFIFPDSLYYIGESAFYGHNMKKIVLPKTMKIIGKSAFHSTNTIDEVSLPEQMEEIGDMAFDSYAPIQIRIPNGIKHAYMSSFKFVEGQTWYFPETVEFIENPICGNNKCIFYLEAKHVVGITSKQLYSSISVEDALRKQYLNGLTVYVPKGMIKEYKNSDYWYSSTYIKTSSYSTPQPVYAGYYVTCYWANADFKEMSNPVKSISLDKSELIFTKLGEINYLKETIEPENADDKSVNWMSTNPNVCLVTTNGQVISTGYGTAIVICTSTDGGFVAICNVKVIQPVKIMAKSYVREYGDENPTFEYTFSGDSIDGTPEIMCEATRTSPVGTYPIVISKGSVTNLYDIYENGELTITKAPLFVSVGDYEKEQGEENPTFSLTYEGFKNQETSKVLIKEPTITTSATKESSIGEYDIIVYGGEAQNYEFHYVNGTLTVTLPNGIGNADKDGTKAFDVFSISGIRLRSKTSSLDDLQKGLYIINGKKVVR
ncbi:MAG: leucine-rich repeat protein [Prevotella sp.]|nr:leucine-rich repeat protein [Prevotella sp.]